MTAIPGWIINVNFRPSCHFRHSMVSLRWESRIQVVPETAEAGTPMNRDLRNCCDPYLNHANLEAERTQFPAGGNETKARVR